MGRVSVIEINVLPKVMFWFQTIVVIQMIMIQMMHRIPWQKDRPKFAWKKKWVKYKVLQDGRLGLPDSKLCFACCFFGLDGKKNIAKK